MVMIQIVSRHARSARTFNFLLQSLFILLVIILVIAPRCIATCIHSILYTIVVYLSSDLTPTLENLTCYFILNLLCRPFHSLRYIDGGLSYPLCYALWNPQGSSSPSLRFTAVLRWSSTACLRWCGGLWLNHLNCSVYAFVCSWNIL